MELFAGYVLIELYVSVADTLYNGICHLRHLLSLLAFKVVLHKPLSYKLLGELSLRLALFKLLLVALCIEVSA